MVRYFLLHLTRGVFESCERERQILQDVDKTIYSFLFKKMVNTSKYIRKEKCQVNLNLLEDSYLQYKIKDLTEKIA